MTLLPRAFVAILLLAVAGCAADAGSSPAATDPWAAIGETVRDMPPDIERAEGRIGPTGGTIFQPSSVQIEQGLAYRFTLGHCGLLSPIDVDGSFWDPIEGVDPDGAPLDLESDGEMINATAGLIVVIENEARFRTESGSVIRLARHVGEKEFPGCA